ncbi:MAG: hypothetical protein ACR2Q3_00180 [Woeseiaceae bacterium]
MKYKNSKLGLTVEQTAALLRSTKITAASIVAISLPCHSSVAQERVASHKQHLEALQADLTTMIAAENQIAEFYTARSESYVRGMQALKDCQLADDTTAVFDLSLASHQGMVPLVVERSAYDEMIAQSALSSMENQELRRQISTMYSEIENAQIRVGYFFSDLSRAGTIIWEHVDFSIAPVDPALTTEQAFMAPYETNVSYEFGELCSDRAFKNAYYEIFDSTNDRLMFGTYVVSQMESLRDAIEAELRR